MGTAVRIAIVAVLAAGLTTVAYATGATPCCRPNQEGVSCAQRPLAPPAYAGCQEDASTGSCIGGYFGASVTGSGTGVEGCVCVEGQCVAGTAPAGAVPADYGVLNEAECSRLAAAGCCTPGSTACERQ
jgi:hypothetical protein